MVALFRSILRVCLPLYKK